GPCRARRACPAVRSPARSRRCGSFQQGSQPDRALVRLLHRPLHHHRTTGTGNLDTEDVTLIRDDGRLGCRANSRQTDRHKPGGRGHVTCSPRLTDPAPHHVGVEAVIQGNTGNRRAWHQAFGHNTSLQLFGVTATLLVGFGYAYGSSNAFSLPGFRISVSCAPKLQQGMPYLFIISKRIASTFRLMTEFNASVTGWFGALAENQSR